MCVAAEECLALPSVVGCGDPTEGIAVMVG